MQHGLRTLSLALALVLVPAAPLLAAELTPEQTRSEMAKLPWLKGPAQAPLGNKAALALPKGDTFLGEADGSKFLELTGNLPSPGHSVLVADNWWAVLSFSDVGYVKDDEKLDPDALLKALKDSDGPANEERKKRGLGQLTTDGWLVPPHYDTETKHLEWGLKLRAEGESEPIINYTVRLLGRSGYENVILVSSPKTLEADVKELKAVLKGFEFNSGERYSEFKPGDHVAEFGLGALVLGGAAAAAAKSGFFKVLLGSLAAFWKLILGAGIALVAGIGKLFGRKKD
jgi:uncharacterized membrane-anchored protein